MNTINYLRKRVIRASRRLQVPGITGKMMASAAIFAVSMLLLTGCDNTFSIFKTISQEKKQIGADLFLNAEVRAMADDSTNYYVLLAQVYYRPNSGSSTTWEPLKVNSSSDYFASGLASDGTNVYVAKSDRNNVLDDIYVRVDQGSNWTAMGAKADLESALGSGASVDWIKCSNGILFVEAHDTSLKYALFYYASSSFKSTGVTGISNDPLKDVVYDGTTQYWTISTSNVYTGTPGSMAIDSSSGNPSLSGGLMGITTDGAGRVLVTRSDGLAYSNVSGAWSNSAIKSSTKLGPAFFLSTGGSRILIGKGISTYGYMEYDESGPTLYESGNSYLTTSSSIYYGSMLSRILIGFWQPSSNPNVLFALLAAGGTDSYSLYRNDFDATTSKWSGWTAE